MIACSPYAQASGGHGLPDQVLSRPGQLSAVVVRSFVTTVADEQRGHLPKWGRTHDPDTEE
eukprot:2744043-Pyramimonas_sp.AAC.1